MKNVLVFVPDLSLNGAQTVMFELARVLIKLSYCITIVSTEEGEYKEKYEEIGANVIIRQFVFRSEEEKEQMRNDFDLVILNSSSCIPYLYFFINTSTKVILWLHESEQQFKNTGTYLPPPQLLSPNIKIMGVTKRVQLGIRNLYDYDIDILPMPICERESSFTKECEKAVFFIPAGYTYIKGQDILLSAISKLSGDYIKQSEFIFCGYTIDGQREYYEKIKQMAEKMDNVRFLGALDREEVYEYYQKCDCVVAPSRIDSTPTSIVEAMMFKKLVLVSSGAGISEYITDCVNGFVFNNEDELLKRLLLIISDYNNLSVVGEKGYEVYRESFSPESVEEKLVRAIEELS